MIKNIEGCTYMEKEIKYDKELHENEEVIQKELLKDSIDDIDIMSEDIDIGELNFDDEDIEDIDFEFEDLFLDDVQKFDKEFDDKITEKEITNIIDEKENSNKILTENIEKSSEESLDMDSLLSAASNEADEESFDVESLLTENTEEVNEEKNNIESDSIETSKEPSEESFDMDSLLSGTSEKMNEEVDGASNTNSLNDILASSETDDFSLEGLFDGDLDFSSSSDESTSLENQESTLDNLENMLDSSVLDAMPDAEEMALAEEKKEKKKGIFARLFGNVKDEKWEKQKAKEEQKEEERRLKEAEKKKAKEEAEEGEKELTKEEKKAAKKAEKEAKKAAKKEAKEQAKREKEEKKTQEKEANVEEVIEDEGRINKVGASIVFAFFGVCAISVVVGTNMFSYNQNIKNATNLFDIKKYSQAYEQIRGLKVKSKDEEIYNKIVTVMYVDKQLNSYNNYYGIKLYPEALDSLLKGLDKYDKHLYEAKQLGVKEDFDYVKSEILAELGNTFEVSEQEAYDIIDIQDKEKYSKKVRKIANGEE